MTEKRIVIGRIGAAYGVKGWVKVISFTEDPESLFDYAPWHVQVPEALRGEKGGIALPGQGDVELESYKEHGDGWVAKLKQIDDRTQAEKLRGIEIWIDESQLPELDDGDFYWSDLEGLRVTNEQGQLLGKVDHLRETGSNDILVVQGCEGSIDQRERWIPWNPDEVIKKVDLNGGSILVDWDADF